MAVELTPELIAICLAFTGILIGFAGVAVQMVKVGRWMERIDARLDNLEEGQQLLTALQNHIHGPDGLPPLFYAPPPQSPPVTTPSASGETRPV